MKKVIVTGLILTALISTPSVAFAKSFAATRPNTAVSEEVQVKISSIRKERIRNYFAHMVTRLEALVERLEKLATRIEQRIAKIKANNEDVDTTSAEKDLSEAKTKIASAKTELSNLKTEMENTLEATDYKEAFKKVRESLSKIKKDLREAHRLMVHSIGEIKGLRVGDSNDTNEQ